MIRFLAIALASIIFVSGCKTQEEPLRPSKNLSLGAENIFLAYAQGGGTLSGPQCRFFSEKLKEELALRPAEYCKGSLEPSVETPPIQLAVWPVYQKEDTAKVALATCSLSGKGWFAQVPSFFQMSRGDEGLWLADSLPRFLIREPGPASRVAGEMAMQKILRGSRCQDRAGWGQDQWFSYQKVWQSLQG